MNKAFFHITAKGADARHFIIRPKDYYAAFNLVGVCAANTRVVVVSFSVEDSHPHILLWGTEEDCMAFKIMYETLYKHYAAATRPNGSELVLNCELYPIGDDESYLRNVAIYTVIQPTKDGKPIMFFDYRWGTGSMYFRNGFYTPVWYFDENGKICKPERFGDQDSLTKRALLHSRHYTIPDDWLVCNGVILPENYIDVARFEGIYQTYNRYRVFASSPKKREDEMNAKMAEFRGVAFEDMEARKQRSECLSDSEACQEMAPDSFRLSVSPFSPNRRKTTAVSRRLMAFPLRQPPITALCAKQSAPQCV